MPKPLLIIINGPPGVGKTTLGRYLASELKLPFLHRDGIAETLFDGLECATQGRPALIGSASFKLLYYTVGCVLDAGQSLIVEGSFYSTERATSELLQLQAAHPFFPLQILCYGDGNTLLERFIGRATTPARHVYHRDLAFAEQNAQLFRSGRLAPLGLDGSVHEIDLTDFQRVDHAPLLAMLSAVLAEIHRQVIY